MSISSETKTMRDMATTLVNNLKTLVGNKNNDDDMSLSSTTSYRIVQQEVCSLASHQGRITTKTTVEPADRRRVSIDPKSIHHDSLGRDTSKTATRYPQPHVSREIFHTVQKSSMSHSRRPIAAVTPFAHPDQDHNPKKALDDHSSSSPSFRPLAKPPRYLNDQFESLSVQILNSPPSEVEIPSNGRVMEEEDLSLNFPDPNGNQNDDAHNEDENGWMDDSSIYGRELEGTQVLLLQNERHGLLQQVERQLHNVFFGSHDESDIVLLEKDASVGVIVPQIEYETCLEYVWHQWIVPMSTMVVVTAPAAYYMYDYCRELERIMLQAGPMTWTEWFSSWY